jgi:hypothetical protein
VKGARTQGNVSHARAKADVKALMRQQRVWFKSVRVGWGYMKVAALRCFVDDAGHVDHVTDLHRKREGARRCLGQHVQGSELRTARWPTCERYTDRYKHDRWRGD